MRDVYGTLFKDVSQINWEEKSTVEVASRHTYEISCIACHENLFPIGLTTEGEEAHLYYNDHSEELHCINCHLSVGHYSETQVHAKNVEFGKAPVEVAGVLYEAPAVVENFQNFTEFVPGTSVKFEMKAIPGGKFMMGSPTDEKMREEDEGPVRELEVSDFFMAEIETTWDMYLAFFSETGSEGRLSEEDIRLKQETDGISGPTPPWGAPDQGWGKGDYPAITMSHYAAEVFCDWLSLKTGRKYRLPTEAEWEYAARASTDGPYFFPGSASDYTEEGLLKKVFGPDTSVINTYTVYRLNSRARTAPPERVLPNPYGLKHMLGNVAEFCSDYYSQDILTTYTDGIRDPKGPVSGDEWVIRGGSFRDDASDIRCASREPTRTPAWLKTDPQMPKSKWWYSDAVHVGFRVVCEFEKSNSN